MGLTADDGDQLGGIVMGTVAMRKKRRALVATPTIIAAVATAWYGFDFWVLRSGADSPFTYYGSLPDAAVDAAKGVLALVGAAMMVAGVVTRVELVTRIGYLLAALAYAVFAVGFLVQALLVGENPTRDSAISAATPGMTYALLGLWMALTAVARWDESHDPHS